MSMRRLFHRWWVRAELFFKLARGSQELFIDSSLKPEYGWYVTGRQFAA